MGTGTLFSVTMANSGTDRLRYCRPVVWMPASCRWPGSVPEHCVSVVMARVRRALPGCRTTGTARALDDDALGGAGGNRREEAVSVAVAIQVHADHLVDAVHGDEIVR